MLSGGPQCNGQMILLWKGNCKTNLPLPVQSINCSQPPVGGQPNCHCQRRPSTKGHNAKKNIMKPAANGQGRRSTRGRCIGELAHGNNKGRLQKLLESWQPQADSWRRSAPHAKRTMKDHPNFTLVVGSWLDAKKFYFICTSNT